MKPIISAHLRAVSEVPERLLVAPLKTAIVLHNETATAHTATCFPGIGNVSRMETRNMAGYHVVIQGECLASIARHYGFANYMTIYSHPANESFRRKRPNPHVIHPGDEIFIPELNRRTENRDTDQKHRFEVKRAATLLRLIVLGENAEPLAGVPWQLLLGNESYSGETGSDGLLEQPIPSDLTTGVLKVEVTTEKGVSSHRWSLAIGSLDPAEETTGIQARLNNLGFPCGDVDGVLGPKTEAAIRRFQKVNGQLEADGIPGPATRSKLEAAHGC